MNALSVNAFATNPYNGVASLVCSRFLLGFVLLTACDGVRGDPDRSAPVEAVEAVEEPADEGPTPDVPASEPTPDPAAPPFGLPALTDAEREALYAGPMEVTKSKWRHHVKTNEARHDLFFPYIRNLGGIYLGVASDHNYTMIAVARAKYAFLFDIDHAVNNTHRIYAVFVRLAETPDELIAFFSREARDRSLALLGEGLSHLSRGERVSAKTTFTVVRHVLHKHLQRIRKRSIDGAPTSWLSDDEMYGYIRRMFETDRIRVMSGDLRGDQTLRTVAAAAESLGETINVYYESNAAEWIIFERGYIRNIRRLPVGDDAVVLRTIDTKSTNGEHPGTFSAADGRWNYNVHAFGDYRTHLRDQYFNRNLMLKVAEREGRLKRDTGKVGLSLIAVDP